MPDEDFWSRDAQILEDIGRHLDKQKLAPVSVELPRRLVDAAIAAWEREDAREVAEDETLDGRRIRNRAGTLGLMGLAFSQQELGASEHVIVTINPDLVGAALQAAWGED